MLKVPLSRTKIETKLAIIREAIPELQKLVLSAPRENFLKNRTAFAAAEHYLRRALEAIFDIGGHIVSRFPASPGQRPSTLKGIAVDLGERGILDKTFAGKTLTRMAGYRNRLVHFYEEITPQELYDIIANKLGDFDIFAKSILELLENPSRFNLTAEE